MEQRNNQNDSIYSLANAAVLASDPTQPCGAGTTGTCEIGPLSGGLFAPQTRTNIAPRIDLQLGQKNTLTARYQFYRNNQSGRIGSTSLPSLSSDSMETESTVQLSDSWIVNEHIVNETRFQYLRDYSSTTPVSPNVPLVSVPGAFTGGGSSGQTSTDHTNHFELQNITTMTVGTQAIKFGTRLRDNRDAESTNSNFNGSFTFASIADYVSALNSTGALPTRLTYTTGPQGALANVFDAALFFQDDWKVNKNLTLSGGIRWESQNHIADHDDWAPRVAFAYALDGHKDSKQAKTVLRGGYGIFYDRFSTDNMLSAERYNGSPASDQVITIADPTCFNNSVTLTISGNCGSAEGTRTIYQVAPGYHSPYTQQAGVSLERQLTKTTTLTGTYLHSFGVHEYVTRDSNAYLPGTFVYGGTPPARPNPAEGIVNQFYPDAVYKQNQVIVNLNAHFTPNFGVTGFYNFTVANSDGGNGSNASNSYDLSQDYGRGGWVSRNMVFLMANYQAPWAIRFNPFLIAQSGKPFNITTTNDLTGDNFFNDRPSYASAASNPANVVQTSFGALDTVPQAGETIIPLNLGTGPAAFALNLRVSRAIGFGPKLAPGVTGGPPQGGGGGGGRGFGGPGPFGGGGGGGRGGMFGPTNTGRKYTLTFNAQISNLFNDIDRSQPVGSLIPTLNTSTGLYGPGSQFDKSTSLAGGFFSSGSAARRIFFQTTFAF